MAKLGDTSEWRSLFFIYSLIAITISIYIPGLYGVFLVDDFGSLEPLNVNGGVTTWENFTTFVFGNGSGMLGRPISMLSFLINDQAFPGSVSAFRYTNLMFHCLCGLLLYLFSYHLLLSFGTNKTKTLYISLAAMAWWIFAPLHVSTTLYIVQRMTQLSTLFILAGLTLYLLGRHRLLAGDKKGWLWVISGLYGCGALALFSKESGSLIFVYALACEMFLNSQKKNNTPVGMSILLFTPIILMIVYIHLRWAGIEVAYSLRDFSLSERLLTESSILTDYLAKLVFPFSGRLGLIHDDYPIAESLFFNIRTPVSLIIHLCLVVSSWRLRGRYPAFLFAVIWFYGGHLLESTVIPLELYFEHRNYLPSVGVFIGMAHFAFNGRSYRYLKVVILGVLITSALFLTKQRAEIWGNPEWQTLVWAAEHPNSVRAQTKYGEHLLKLKSYARAEEHFLAMVKKWPSEIHFQVVIFNGQCKGDFSGRPDVGSIVDRAGSSNFNGNLSSVVKQTLYLYEQGACEELNSSAVHRLVGAMNTLNKLQATFASTLNYYDAGIYIAEGNLQGAMDSLDTVLVYENLGVVYFRQAKILYSAGLFLEAKVKLNEAISREGSVAFANKKKSAIHSALMRAIDESLKIDADGE